MPIMGGNPGLGMGAPAPGPGGDDQLIRLALQRLLAQQGGGQGAGGPPSVVNNVYGGLSPNEGGQGQAPAAFGGGGIGGGGGGPGPQGDPYAEDPRDYMVDIVRQQYPEGSEAVLTDPQDPNSVLQKIQMPHGGWVKRVHRWVRPKKKADQDPAGMQVDPLAPYGR